ncbi:ferritin-like domain-containing protein [Spiroplasma taiwanense]|uniref:Ferritin-like diiron domain-containing protein n=1 Tax=Spiroplasma taiwanense CT-1 TaxID=1276220 RepID=S5MAY4_9MOLU|nr:ferritin-like domain-containing protein [Spiroplasma taiwanense]AGR40928.1 hypothetical protein STAIW_v1c02640 [Spiroplasma taiwanense CT-1]
MLNKKIQKDLQKYIDEHAIMQNKCFNLSKNCNELGYPGFTHFFQVQAQDEFLHQRRIMNYLLGRNSTYIMNTLDLQYKNFDSIIEIIEEYKKCREHFALISNEFWVNAQSLKDIASVKFYEWFIIDFYEEISEINDLLDWIKMSNGNFYNIDKKLAKRENPDTELVVDPFSPHS